MSEPAPQLSEPTDSLEQLRQEGMLIIEPPVEPAPLLVSPVEAPPPLIPQETEPGRGKRALGMVHSSGLALLWGILLVGAATIPALLATAFPGDRRTEGGYFLAADTPQFLSAIHQGRVDGSWLFTDHFTAEPHPPAFVYPLYLLLGHVAAILGLSDVATYDAASLVSRVVLWLALAALAGRVLRREERNWAYLLAIAGGGFLIGVALVTAEGAFAPGSSSYLPPNPHLLYTMMAAPHWMLGLAAFLFIVLLLIDLADHVSLLRVLLLGLCTVALGLTFPFLLPVVGSIALVCAILAAAQWQRVRGSWVGLVAIGLTALPFVAYNGLLFTVDEFWSGVYGAAQNQMTAPPPWFLPVYLGVVVLPAIWALATVWKSARRELRLLAIAALVTLAWMYLPVSFQRRAGFPATTLLALLGGAALASGWLARYRRVPLAVISLGLAETALAFALIVAAALGRGPWPTNGLPEEQAQLAEWLAPRVGREDVVLAPAEFSAFLGSRIDGRVSAAEAGTSTRNWLQKRDWVQTYFGQTTDPGDRRALERQLGNPVWLVAPTTFVPGPTWVRTSERGGLVVYFRPRPD